jgi:hypothetical protein
MGCGSSKATATAQTPPKPDSSAKDAKCNGADEMAKSPQGAKTNGAHSGKLPGDARIIFVLGGPGSGKGTQCEKVLAKCVLEACVPC